MSLHIVIASFVARFEVFLFVGHTHKEKKQRPDSISKLVRLSRHRSQNTES